MSLSDTQYAFLQDIALLIQFCANRGIKVTAGEAYRTEEQQQIYVDTGKSWAKHSRHQDRLAMDFNFFINGTLTYKKSDLQAVGDFWESLDSDNIWGGNWSREHRDTPHFERRP